jgi:YD repeat-containing protein
VAHTYDTVGRRTASTITAYNPITATSQPQTTYFYYNEDGQLRFTVNALGERTESRYNALGQVTEQLGYANRI